MGKEIYVSIDIECDGPIPSSFSMLSLGAVAFDDGGVEIDSFSVNLHPLPKARTNPETMRWWKTHPEAWAAVQTGQVYPEVAMRDFSSWLDNLPGTPIFVGYPVTFDFTFVSWYLQYFTGSCPFGWAGLDIKTNAMAYMGSSYRGSAKRHMPKEWSKNRGRHSHIAIEDAREQGHLFFNIRKSLRELKEE